MGDPAAGESAAPDGAFDAEKWLLRSQQKAAQARATLPLRPTWADLGNELAKVRQIANGLLLSGDDSRQFAPRKLKTGTRKSRASTDRAAQRSSVLNRRNQLIEELVGEYVVALSDHLWTVITILRAEPPFRPLMANGRILLDAAAHIRYLIDSDVPLEVRRTRAANLELNAVREELADLGSGEDATELTTRRAQVLAAGDADGAPRARSKAGVPQESFEPPLIPTGQMADLILGDDLGTQIWRLASSVVHAKDRSVISFVAGRGDIDLTESAQTIGLPFLAPCLFATLWAYRDVAAYLRRSKPELERQLATAIWTLEAMGGVYDDDLLNSAGVDRSGWV